MGCFVQTATSDKHGADRIDKVVHGINVGGEIGPVGHGARGGEESAEQEETHHEEPHDEHGLLHGVTVVGDHEPEGREEKSQQHGEYVDEPHRPYRRDAIDEPRQQQADGDDEQGDEPVWDEFGEDERQLGYRRDVNLLNGASLFLANNVECW